jgi:putative endonuclease
LPVMITEKRNTGDRGEELVCQFLMKQGFTIVDRNHWRKWGEIDIVAKSLKDNVYHFIEVKTAVRDLGRLDLSDDYSPADNMTKDKMRKFSRIIQTYIEENRLGECNWQADVALVYLDKYSDNLKIELLEDIDL